MTRRRHEVLSLRYMRGRSESVMTLGRWVRRQQMGRRRKRGRVLAVGVLAALVTVAPLPWPVPPVVAATFTVTTTADTVDANLGDNACADNSNNCSLRAAIMQANALAGADTIVLQSGQTYTLSRDADGGGHETDSGADNDDLDITSAITIRGNGATIRRDPTLGCNLDDEGGTGEFRIFDVASGGSLTLQNLTVRDGCADGSDAHGNGGGIYNSASDGGTATLTVTNSTISGNSAELGGGILNYAFGRGSTVTLTLTNSTLSGNSADVVGGGILNNGTANLSFVTIASNSASTGGGIWNDVGTANIKNSIVGNNTAALGPNCALARGRFTPRGVNFATDTSCSGFRSITSAQLNLGPLANNGGPTQTHALLSGSAAIDAVPLGQCTNLASAPVTQDQRGVSRPQGSNCDAGAYEAPASLVRRVTLQGGGNCLLLNLEARTYRFRTSAGDLYTGPINLTRRGSRIQFSNLRMGETWILGGAAELTPSGQGQAVLRTYSPWRTFSIADPNLSDNTCVP